MALDDLSALEQAMASELSALNTDPGAERRARIMATVRKAPAAPRASFRLWRAGLAAATALAVLVAGSVGAVAASSDALPSSPNYPLRSIGEHVRLTVADGPTKEQLRISFAQTRIAQADDLLTRGKSADARDLLRDSQTYLDETRQDLGGLSSDEQGNVENQLNQLQAQQDQAEAQLNQQGQQGQSQNG